MANDKLQLIIGTVINDDLNKTAKAMADAIDEFIVEELKEFKMDNPWKINSVPVNDTYDWNHTKYYSKNTPLDYNSLSKYMDDHTKYYLKRNIKNG